MSEEERVRRRRRKKITPWQRRRRRVLFVLGLFALLLSVWFVWRLEKRSRLNDALREVAALGVPATRSGYEERFGQPYKSWNHEEEISPDSPYQPVLDAYVLPDLANMDTLPHFGGRYEAEELAEAPYPATMLEALRSFVATNEKTLDLLHQAALSGVAVPLSWEQTGRLVELLCMEACLSAHEGNGAFESLEDSLVLLRGGERDFSNDSRAIYPINSARKICVALESALRRTRFTDVQLSTFQAHLDAGDWLSQAHERKTIWQSRYLIESEQTSHRPVVYGVANLFVGFHDVYRANELRAWCVQHKLLGLPLAEQEARIAGFEGEFLHEFLHIERSPMMPIVVRTALDVVRYELAEGVLPESLEALIPMYIAEVPIDFWSATPLRYQMNGQGFMVYSVGSNRDDDGGDRRSDIVFKTVLPTNK